MGDARGTRHIGDVGIARRNTVHLRSAEIGWHDPFVDLAFDVATPLGFLVRCTHAQWVRITTVKHPPMMGRLDDVIATLSDPDEARRSVRDRDVILFHRHVEPRWVCAVAKRDGVTGFLITAYPADKVKEGEILWKK